MPGLWAVNNALSSSQLLRACLGKYRGLPACFFPPLFCFSPHLFAHQKNQQPLEGTLIPKWEVPLSKGMIPKCLLKKFQDLNQKLSNEWGA